MTAENALNKLSGQFQDFVKLYEQQNDSMQAMFSDKKIKGMFGETEASMNRRHRARKRELELAERGAKAAVNLNNATVDLEVAMQHGAEASIRQTRETVRYLKQMKQNGLTLDRAQKQEIDDLIQLANATGDLTPHLQRLNTVMQAVGKQELRRMEEQVKINKVSEQFGESLHKAKKAAIEWAKSVFSISSGLVRMAQGYDKMIEDVHYSLKNQVPVVDRLSEGFSDLNKSMLLYGITSRKLAEVQKSYAQALNAASRGVGQRATTKELMTSFKALGDQAQLLTGSYEDALELVGSSMDLLSYSGVKMGMEEMSRELSGPGGLLKSLENLSRTTNTTVQELVKMNKGIMADHDVRMLNVALSEDERRNFAQRMVQQQQFLVARGLEIEQAVEATAALAKMQKTITPKDRYKQAAKMRAIAGAMGVQGGEEMMRLAMKPQNKWTKEEFESQQNFMTKLDTRMGEMYGGGFASQMIAGQFQETMGGPLYDAMSKMSSVGMEARDLSKEQLAGITQTNTQLTGIQNILNAIDTKIGQPLKSLFSEGAMSMALGMGQALGGLVIAIFQLTAAIRLMGAANALKGVGGAAKVPGILSKAGGAIGIGKSWGALGTLGKLGVAGGGLLGAGMVGKDIYDVLSGDSTAGNVGGAMGGVVGAGIGLLGGPAGAALGATIGNVAGEFIGEGIGKLMDMYQGKTDENVKALGDTSANTMMESQTKLLEEFQKNQEAVLEKLSTSNNPQMTALVEALQNNAALTTEQQAILKDFVDVTKNSVLATKDNTVATQLSNETYKSITSGGRRVMLQHAPNLG